MYTQAYTTCTHLYTQPRTHTCTHHVCTHVNTGTSFLVTVAEHLTEATWWGGGGFMVGRALHAEAGLVGRALRAEAGLCFTVFTGG